MLSRLTTYATRLPRTARATHCTKRYLLVGPIDPVSHLRPVLYDDGPSLPPSTNTNNLHHPYSLAEFVPNALPRKDDCELQYKLQRQQLDAFHQTFWTDSNLRFEAGKHAILSSLPESSTPLQKEQALSHFYTQWLTQEASATDDYTTKWRKRLIDCMSLGIRVHYDRLKARYSSTDVN